jgi:transmembrane sensor
MSEQYEKTKALKALFVKYLNGDVTKEEGKRIELWYDALEKDPVAKHSLTDGEAAQTTRKTILKQVHKAITGTSDKRHAVPVLKYAASLLLITGITFFYIRYINVPREQFVTKVIETGAGLQKNIVLADGSNILLNAESKLVISGDFNRKDRKVILTGEAFFHIAKDHSRPFIIRSGDLKTTVLGTSFNINAYPGLESIKISVATGKVKVAKALSNGGDGILSAGMIKDQTLVFNNKTKTALIKQGNTELLSSWDKGELYIDNASITDIAQDLERHYRMPVKLSPEVSSDDRYTVQLGNEPIATSIRVLSDLTHLKFIVKQNQLYIMKRK